MSQEHDEASLDLIRWTFSINPEHRAAIEGHLHDLGLDVLVHDGEKFIVTWDEPEGNVEEVIEEIWELNGEPFEITQEDFRRLELHTYHPAEDEASHEAA